MNYYEQMKNMVLMEIENAMPETTSEQYEHIGRALDKAANMFEIQKKETALSVVKDPIPDAAKMYIVVKKTEGLSQGTLENYARILKQFFCHVNKELDNITANDIRLFLYQYQQCKKISDRTLDKYRQMICWFFSWAYREDYINKDPSKSVKAIRHEVKERNALTQLELERLRLGCKTKRDKAILEFLFSTGCRVSELSIVRKEDVNLKDGTVHLFGKGRKHRTSFINAKCEIALGEYLNERTDDSEYLFVTERAPIHEISKGGLEKIVNQIASNSGLGKHITPHIIRHTTATLAVNNGMPIEAVSKLLGHANVSTTMIYAKVSKDIVHAQHTRYVI